MKRKLLLMVAICLTASMGVVLLVSGGASAQETFPREAKITADIPDAATAGEEYTFAAVAREKTEGAPMKHCDGVIRIRKGAEVVREEEFHSHNCEPGFTHTFSERGSYKVSITMSYLAELFPVKNKTLSAENIVEVQ